MPSILKVAEATNEMKGVEFALLSSSDGSAMTGQAGSTTVRLRLNGVEAAGTGTVVELDATNRPGLYAYRLATAELANEAYGLMRPVCSGAVAADYPFWITPNDPLGEALDTDAIDATISANTKVVAIETKVTTLPANVEQTFADQTNRLIDIETDTIDLQTRVPAALVGGRIDANVGAISADDTAADNLEAALDGTGGVTITAGLTGNVTGNLSGSVGSVTGAVGSVTGNVGGNVVGSVASVTGNVGGNVAGSVNSVVSTVASNLTQIRGDTTAAQNFEADYDGTGYSKSTSTVGTVTTVTTLTNKTGFSLASTGLDAISTTASSGVPSTFREMIVWVYRRFAKKTEYDSAAGTIKTYADDNTTVVTTQAVTEVGDVETVGAAS